MPVPEPTKGLGKDGGESGRSFLARGELEGMTLRDGVVRRVTVRCKGKGKVYERVAHTVLQLEAITEDRVPRKEPTAQA